MRLTIRLAAAGVFVLHVSLAVAAHAAQEEVSAPRVYLDCLECDYEWVQTEIRFVTFVTEQTAADVHVLVTSEPAGGGGTMFTLDFLGRGRFAGAAAILHYVRRVFETDDELRRGLTDRLKLGLVRYAAETSAADQIQITAINPPATTPRVSDRWNSWTFVSSLNGTFSNEDTNGSNQFAASFSADRTTRDWKMILSIHSDYSSDTFRLGGQPALRTSRRTFSTNGLVVRTVRERWAAGLKMLAGNSSYLNQDLALRIAPGFEFNVFPYSQSTSRRLTIEYTAGPNRFNYVAPTIFDRLRETRYDETVLATFDMKQRRGSVSTGLEGSHYFSGPDLYRFVAFAQGDVRVYRGLSVNLSMTSAFIHDQVYLARQQVSVEDVLLRSRQFATSRRMLALIGFTYTFGSVYATTVNSRFMGTPAGFLLVQ